MAYDIAAFGRHATIFAAGWVVLLVGLALLAAVVVLILKFWPAGVVISN